MSVYAARAHRADVGRCRRRSLRQVSGRRIRSSPSGGTNRPAPAVTVATGPGASAELAFTGGTRLVLGSPAMLGCGYRPPARRGTAGATGSCPDISVRLDKGTMRAASPPGGNLSTSNGRRRGDHGSDVSLRAGPISPRRWVSSRGENLLRGGGVRLFHRSRWRTDYPVRAGRPAVRAEVEGRPGAGRRVAR